MSDFWARQRAKAAEQNKQQAPERSQSHVAALPFWADDGYLETLKTRQNSSQGRTEALQPQPGIRDENHIDGHDVSRADFLKGSAFECPNCPVNPDTGVRGNMYRPTRNSALRCFDCGYIEDNRFASTTSGMIAVREGPVHRARQTVSGGAGGRSQYVGESGKSENVVGRIR